MIKFFNADISFVLRDKKKIFGWIVDVAKKNGCTIRSLNLIVCSDEFLYQLNMHHLNHDTYTDILTFDFSHNSRKLEGEIYVSVERVKENAEILGIAFKNELHRVLIHGVLHLCGFKDKTKAQKKEMVEAEDKALGMRKFIYVH